MTDTAQLPGAAETDPIADAALAFKAFGNPSAAQPRDDTGRFASTAEEAAEDEDEAPLTADEAEGEAADEPEADEADEEAAEPAQPMPPSWGAEEAELWATLPPEAQAKIAEREGERDRGLNLKLQETANARKAAEATAKEVSTKLEDLNRVIETVEAIYKTPEPDARAFGYGTQQFNEAAYRAAHQQWAQTEQVLAQLNEQRETARKDQSEAEKTAFAEWKQQHEEQFAPKLLADVPDLKIPEKAVPLVQGLVKYAVESGIPQEVFAPEAQDEITSAQLHILWKAQQFDKLKAANTAPKPKPAGPAVKPGVSSPRSAQRAAREQKARDRLAREGSIEAGAAVFKQFFK